MSTERSDEVGKKERGRDELKRIRSQSILI